MFMVKFKTWLEAKKKKENSQQMSLDFDVDEKPEKRYVTIQVDYASEGGQQASVLDSQRNPIYTTRTYKNSEFRMPGWTDEDIAQTDPKVYLRSMTPFARDAAYADARKWAKENNCEIVTY